MQKNTGSYAIVKAKDKMSDEMEIWLRIASLMGEEMDGRV